MRLAVISDIHANEVAFRTVIKDIELHGADQIVCLGDVITLGPMPVSVLETLQDLNCHCILGNHDAFMIKPESIHIHTPTTQLLWMRYLGVEINCSKRIWILSAHSKIMLSFHLTAQPGCYFFTALRVVTQKIFYPQLQRMSLMKCLPDTQQR